MKNRHLQIVSVAIILIIVSAGILSDYRANTEFQELTKENVSTAAVATEIDQSHIRITQKKARNNRKRGSVNSKK